MFPPQRLAPSLVALVAAIGSFMLSRVIWPDLPGMIPPTSSQLPFFIGVGVFESVAFGVGVAFVIFGWKFLRGRRTGDYVAFLSAAWLLVSWWPHDNLHRVTVEGNYWGLLKLEWGFHVTLMIAGVIIASHLWKEYMPRA